MYALVHGIALDGLKANIIKVEVDISNGLPSLDVVGLASTSVKEARDRVRAALKNSGYQLPLQRITVNLAPADLRKEGSGLDLAIVMGVLTAMGEIDAEKIKEYVFVGELSLEGKIRGISGILSMAVEINKHTNFVLVVSQENIIEARLNNSLSSICAENLVDLISILRGEAVFKDNWAEKAISSKIINKGVDWAEILGQQQAKRALEVAAAGGHNAIMAGPPGSGKSLLAKAFASILPPLSEEESLEVTQLYSLAGILGKEGKLITQRPFRQPHHTATVTGIIGGGHKMKPGELILANNGVLFLDELPEFSREVLESLRQPLEDRKIMLIRQRGSVEYPARISLIAAMNPCPCGFFSDAAIACTCTTTQINNYRNRVSGPLMDRMDIQIEVPRLSYDKLRNSSNDMERSEEVRVRIESARNIQVKRFNKSKTNAEMTSRETKEICQLDSQGEKLLKHVFDAKGLSARAHDRILRVSRTIADMSGCDNIRLEHLAEALNYRSLDRQIEV